MIVVACEALVPMYFSEPIHYKELDFQAIDKHKCSKSVKVRLFEDAFVGGHVIQGWCCRSRVLG